MFTKSFRAATLLATAAAAFAGVASHAQRPVISRHIPEIVQSGQAKYLSSMDRGESLHLTLQLPLRNQDKLNALLADLYNPQSANFHKWLTPQEFDIQFGPERQDFNTLVSWAQSKGLMVTFQATNGRLLEAEGTVETVNRAFNVVESNFHDANLNRDFHAPDREPTTDLPFALLAIDGLENSQPKIKHVMKDPAAGIPSTIAAPSTDSRGFGLASITNGLATSGVVSIGSAKGGGTIKPLFFGSGPNGSYLPSDMRAAYYGSGNLTGAGQSVAVFSYDGYLTSDLTVYYNNTGMKTTVPVNNVLVGGYSGACTTVTSPVSSTCSDDEQILDIVQVQGMAPGLKQVEFYEGTSANAILNQMVTDNVSKVVTSSWSGGGFGTASDSYFQQMATQGISYLNATGDSGAFNSSTFGPPGLDPYVIEVGGTVLNTASAGGAWASETAWRYSGGGYWISGINAAYQYAIPTWQSQAGVVTTANAASATYRNVPDFAAEANFDNPTVDNGAFVIGYGGTSFAAPRMAGYLALANQQAVINGQSTVGFVNPALYTAGLSTSASTVYHDITSGTNPSTAGTGRTYTSVAGYDLVTGWGSPNGAGLINTLAGAPAADFSIPATGALSAVRGGSGVIYIPITGYNSYNGTVAVSNLTGLPAGSSGTYQYGYAGQNLTLYIGLPSTATVGTNYTAVATLQDLNNAALVHTISITVTAEKRSNGDFTMTTSGASVPQGQIANAFIQVTPGSGLIESINLTVTGAPPGVTASFFDPLVNPSTSKNVPLTLNVAGYAVPGNLHLTVTGTTSAGFIHSVNLPVTITVPNSLLLNGGFETGSLTPWTTLPAAPIPPAFSR